jgi:dihydrofolate reductase
MRQPDQHHVQEARMGRLIYSMIQSLDGYVTDESGGFDWAEPDGPTHAFVNELERSVGTYLYGRRMYEVMAAWETLDALGDQPPFIEDFAKMWRAASKIVYSTTLDAVSSARTSIERRFDPAVIRRVKDEAVGDISIGGPTLAAHAIRAGLVDEYQMLVAPIVVGGGIRTLPDGVRLSIELADERRLGNGMVYLNYRSVTSRHDARVGPRGPLSQRNDQNARG